MQADQFKSKLKQQLRDNGIQDKLKSEIRARLIQEISLKIAKPAHQTNHIQKQSNLLILQHMKHYNMDFSASVFGPEAGVKSADLQQQDLFASLRLQSTKLSFLEQLVSNVEASFGQKHDQAIQAEETGDMLTRKLRALDFDFKQEQVPSAAVEERMIKYQQLCDDRMTHEVKEQLEVYKMSELQNMQATQQALYDNKLDQMRVEIMGNVHQEEERLAQQRHDFEFEMVKRRQNAEQELYAERQKLFVEMEQLQQKELLLKRESDLLVKQTLLEQQALRDKTTQAQETLREAQQTKDQLKSQLRDEVTKYQLQFDKEHSGQIEAVKLEKAKLETERALLKERSEQFDFIKSQLERSQAQCSKLDEQLYHEKSQTLVAQKEVEQLRQTNVQLQQLYQSLQKDHEGYVKSTEYDMLALRKKGMDIESELQNLKSVSLAKSNEATQKSIQLEDAQSELRHLQDSNQQLKQEVHNIKQENVQLVDQYENAVLDAKELQRELADNRLLLHHSQLALGKKSHFKGAPILTLE